MGGHSVSAVLKMAAQWRSGADRMLESRGDSRAGRASKELDLLLLLEEDAPEVERAREVAKPFISRARVPCLQRAMRRLKSW